MSVIARGSLVIVEKTVNGMIQKIVKEILIAMYSYFYPENNQRAFTGTDYEFETAQEAIDWFRDHKENWSDTKARGENDFAAFMNFGTGDIIVVREMPEEE